MIEEKGNLETSSLRDIETRIFFSDPTYFLNEKSILTTCFKTLNFFQAKIFVAQNTCFYQKDQTKAKLLNQTCQTKLSFSVPLITWQIKQHSLLLLLLSYIYKTKSTKQNLLKEAYLSIPTKPIYLTKLTKPNQPDRTYQIKATKPNQTYQPRPTKPNLNYKIEPLKPNLPNQTFETIPIKPKLPNHTKLTKPKFPKEHNQIVNIKFIQSKW